MHMHLHACTVLLKKMTGNMIPVHKTLAPIGEPTSKPTHLMSFYIIFQFYIAMLMTSCLFDHQ